MCPLLTCLMTLNSVVGLFRAPDVHHESSLVDDIPAAIPMVNIVLTLTKVTASTQRGHDHLTNSRGFSFTVSTKQPEATDRCLARGPHVPWLDCPASNDITWVITVTE